jgi:tryptophanyl-tRNA synthetase
MEELQKKRILSGMRPTGKMHLGNYVGALENWVTLQGEYENYHLVADYHALTTNPDTSGLLTNTIEMICDWLSVGIDPKRSPVFRQSQIKEHTELHLIFSMLITTARLERNPTLKEQVKDLSIDNMIYGHLGYPVLQAADILIYRANLVPVGEDQAPHVEITRELARKFNLQYGEVFPIPDIKMTQFARLPGLDGNKMSKSVGNTILLSDSADEVRTKLKKAVTDPQKIRRGDPGRPEVCLVYTYQQKFNPENSNEISATCKTGALGCVDCKMKCANAIAAKIGPYTEKRNHYHSHQYEVMDILIDGEKRARAVAGETMNAVHKVMSLG